MKKEYPKSDAQKVFQGKPLMTERPTGMDIATYKYLRNLQSKILKKVLHK